MALSVKDARDTGNPVDIKVHGQRRLKGYVFYPP